MKTDLHASAETTTPFTSEPGLLENPFTTEHALKDVPIIKHALEQPRPTPDTTAQTPFGQLMPNPFTVKTKGKTRPNASEPDPATIAVQQLMMKEADANLDNSRDSAPEPDFKGMGRSKKSAASTASDDVDLDVVGYLARQHRKIKTCYEMGLAADPSIEGKITVEFKVSRKGKVKRPRVVSSDMPRSVERCILHTLKRLDFPPHDDPKAVFEYPFFFAR